MKIVERLKKKWGIASNLDFTLIMIVFSLAGLNVSFSRKPIFHLLGVRDSTPLLLKIVLYLAFIFPTYQLSLLLYGFLLGQFGFFWNKQKTLFKFIRTKLLKTHTA